MDKGVDLLQDRPYPCVVLAEKNETTSSFLSDANFTIQSALH